MKVIVGKEEVVLNSELLQFDETNINKFLQNFASHYNYYQIQYANAQYYHAVLEDKYDAMIDEKFRFYKEEKATDKWAEAQARTEVPVMEMLEKVREAKRNAMLLYGFLRAMDKAHDLSLQVCYNIRREMETIFKDKVKNLPYEV